MNLSSCQFSSDEDERVPETTRSESEDDKSSPKKPIVKVNHESEIQMVVEQVVAQLSPILQSICVTDRIQRAENEVESWKQMATVLAKQPNLRNGKWSCSKTSLQSKTAEPQMKLLHPSEQSWEQFMMSPASAPVWTLATKLNLLPMAPVFQKWWRKVNSDTRTDAWTKLAKYLQCIRYFNATSDAFWNQMSTNPTYWSIQKIVVELAFQANWIKGAGLELQDVQAAYCDAAAKIAQSSDAQVSSIFQHLEGLWPANFQPHNLQYEGEPFRTTSLFAQDDASLCVKIARPKGLKGKKFITAKSSKLKSYFSTK